MLLGLAFFAYALVGLATPVNAVDDAGNGGGGTAGGGSGSDGLSCSVLPKFICDSAKKEATNGDVQGTGVYELLKFVLQLLTAGIGIVAVGSVVYAGILYSSAGDNQQQVQQAKSTIKNVAIGIVAFALMFMALNWLIPGGVFG